MKTSPILAVTVPVFVIDLYVLKSDALEATIPAVPDDILPIHQDELSRDDRFPSINERVKLYMGNWYSPPCNDDGTPNPGWIDFSYQNTTENSVWPSLVVSHSSKFFDNNETRRTYQFENIIEPDRVFFLDERVLMDCLEIENGGQGDFADRVTVRKNMLMYCYDAANSLAVALEHVTQEQIANNDLDNDPPTLLQFGDLKHSHVYGFVSIPHFKKFRSATTKEYLKLVTPDEGCPDIQHRALQTVHSTSHPQPIIWKFATGRHFSMLRKIYREDTPWDQKKPQAVFRGQ